MVLGIIPNTKFVYSLKEVFQTSFCVSGIWLDEKENICRKMNRTKGPA